MTFSTGILRQHYLLVAALAEAWNGNEERDTSRWRNRKFPLNGASLRERLGCSEAQGVFHSRAYQ
jgi:hypothetical protein